MRAASVILRVQIVTTSDFVIFTSADAGQTWLKAPAPAPQPAPVAS